VEDLLEKIACGRRSIGMAAAERCRFWAQPAKYISWHGVCNIGVAAAISQPAQHSAPSLAAWRAARRQLKRQWR